MLNAQNHYLPSKLTEQCNLLVVDDEESILKAIKRTFRATKYQVYTASSAKEGFKLLKEHTFQVVLSDFRMPEMDGGTLVKKIKQRYPSIVSMILTGYADFDAAVGVMNSGAAHKFLLKPWDNQQLIDEVDEAFTEYHQRLISTDKAELNEKYIKPDRIHLDRTLKELLANKTEFALASIIVSDISLYDQYWEQKGDHDSALDSIANIIQIYLSKDYSVFEIDVDQLLVIIPVKECSDVLHNQLTLLDIALSMADEDNLIAPKLQCHIAYSLAPFDGMDTPQLLHSIRHLSEQDYRDNQHCGEKSHVVKLDAKYVAQKKRKKTIQNSIQQAINTNQFCLYFQPKVRLDNGLVESAEVLMRWEHTSLGWISPTEFINLSELDGQIVQIGSWLIENSVLQLIDLKEQYGKKIKLAINVSPRQLQNNQIVDELTYLLNKTGLDPACIELEITEGCIIDDLQQTSDVLWKLKSLGVSIAIDDFGSGYASFSYLSKLPVDVLKLDKILIDDLGINSDISDMLQSIIELCRRMNIKVVAEGVEDEQQVEMLRKLGCHYIQGYVYSKPVTKTHFEKILINQPFKLSTNYSHSAIN
jgi:EAL domain-containing protein (putative c-di-GMP-specific phosphodiesterase class I)/FixJ family two-component response regulator